MEQLYNGFTLDIAPGVFPLSTDSMLLAEFVRQARGGRFLDLGSGCGTLGVLLCAADPRCHVTGLELDETAHRCAVENIRRNGLQDRMESICADLRQLPSSIIPGSFRSCVSNPPYFSGGPASQATPLARREDCCAPADLFRAASRALKYGGNFYLVHRPERLAELISAGAAFGLEAKRLRLVHHKEGGPVTLVLLDFRLGGKPGLLFEEVCLFNKDGSPTPYYRRVYHLD